MNIETDYKNSIVFNARLGVNLKSNLLNTEFGGSLKRLKNFEKLFSDTFEKAIDTNTVLEMKNNGRFYLYNPGLKGVKTPVKIFRNKNKTLAQHILSECDIAFSRAEYVLFERFIAANVAKGKSLDKICSTGEQVLDKIRLPYFTDLIESATRILKENPNSKLTELDFSNMISIQLKEIVETPEFQKAMSKGNFSEAVKILKD